MLIVADPLPQITFRFDGSLLNLSSNRNNPWPLSYKHSNKFQAKHQRQHRYRHNITYKHSDCCRNNINDCMDRCH